MKSNRVKIVFGLTACTLLGALIACGGDDGDNPGTSSGSNTSGGSSSSGNVDTDGAASSSSSGSNTSGGSSSGGQTSCNLSYGCYKRTTTTLADGGPFCTAPPDGYQKLEPSDAGPSDGGTTLPEGCEDNGSAQCLVKMKCDNALGHIESELQLEPDRSTTTTSITSDAGVCTQRTVLEKVDDSFCADAGTN